ncbi:hypothetical protein VM1G_11726 [Cytospora mali]|uniref:Uncharacterized protein n=1 Tax=Cytospora mali TaxID=578113 RepID=A0A194W1P3_CYTMA|nr:hypothetical protein VM1G_11726 [Valsa mali]
MRPRAARPSAAAPIPMPAFAPVERGSASKPPLDETGADVGAGVEATIVEWPPTDVVIKLPAVAQLGVCPFLNDIVSPIFVGRLATAAMLVGAYKSPSAVPEQEHTLGWPRTVRVAGPGHPLQRTLPSLVSVPSHWVRPRSCWSEWSFEGHSLAPNVGSVQPAI